jgi:hypothetical protein
MTVFQPSCFMPDVSPAQSTRDMKHYLQSNCLGRWIERSGPGLWSTRSLIVARASCGTTWKRVTTRVGFWYVVELVAATVWHMPGLFRRTWNS